MSRFNVFSRDELHTLATALGNAVETIIKKKSIYPATANYMERCINDAEKLLIEINSALAEKDKKLD